MDVKLELEAMLRDRLNIGFDLDRGRDRDFDIPIMTADIIGRNIDVPAYVELIPTRIPVAWSFAFVLDSFRRGIRDDNTFGKLTYQLVRIVKS